MKVETTTLPGVLLLTPKVFGDARGFFFELWNEDKFRSAGLDLTFRQDNLSSSARGVLRGLHFQNPFSQGKLVSVLEGEVYDVAVDVRPDSPSFGTWEAWTLSSADRRAVYIPPGYAHGFAVVSDRAIFHYKCTEFYHPEAEASVLWNDPDLAIPWPVEVPELSGKDRAGIRLKDIPRPRLPSF